MSYEAPSGGTPYAVPNSNLALVSLITGILGLTFFPIIGSVIAIITGMMGRKEIRESAGALGGDGMATAGVIMGWIGIGLAIFGLCIAGIAFAIPLCVILSEGGNFWILPGLLSLLF